MPFSAGSFSSCLQHAERCGLHTDVLQAQSALQQRKLRAAEELHASATAAAAAAVEAACRGAAQLGLAREVEAALATLKERQAAAEERLRCASHSGSLQEFNAAAAKADLLQVSSELWLACQELLRRRQLQAEEQLRESTRRGDLAAVRRQCQAAQLLGLQAAVEAAQEELHLRRQQTAAELASSTREACQAASLLGDDRALLPESDTASSVAQLLDLKLCVIRLAAAVAEVGASRALAGALADSATWPAELARWLAVALRAEEMELGAAVAQALAVLYFHLQALQACLPVQLMPVWTGLMVDRQQEGQRSHSALLAGYDKWRALQLHAIPLVEAAALAPAAVSEEGRPDGILALDLCEDGPAALEALAPPPAAPQLPAALAALQLLDLSGKGLTSADLAAAGLAAGAPHLTALALRHNRLADLSSWIGPLPSLLHLDVAGNCLSSLEGLAGAAPLLHTLDATSNCLPGLPAAQHLALLRQLRLGGNPLGSGGKLAWPWMPSLLELHLEGCQLHGLPPMQASRACWLGCQTAAPLSPVHESAPPATCAPARLRAGIPFPDAARPLLKPAGLHGQRAGQPAALGRQHTQPTAGGESSGRERQPVSDSKEQDCCPACPALPGAYGW